MPRGRAASGTTQFTVKRKDLVADRSRCSQQAAVLLLVRDQPPQRARVRGRHQARGPVDVSERSSFTPGELAAVEGELLDDEARPGSRG